MTPALVIWKRLKHSSTTTWNVASIMQPANMKATSYLRAIAIKIWHTHYKLQKKRFKLLKGNMSINLSYEE